MATVNCFACFGDQDPVRDGASGALQSKIGELISLLWDLTLGGITNLLFLRRNAERLDLEMKRLKELKGDLTNQAGLQPQMELTNQVKGWMERVLKLESEVTVFQESFQRQSICITRICLGYGAVDKLRRVQELMIQGNGFNSVVSRVPPDAVEEVPSEPRSSIVGGEEILSEIRKCLRDDSIGIIGIYGMGGIGKTEFMKIIHNDFLHTVDRGRFDVVIWATVSKDMNILSIQKAIGERVGLSFSTDEMGDRAKSLFKALREKRYLIFMDDVWVKLDLVKIGVPQPKGRGNCKIAFTTRSLDVCTDMDADQKIEMKVLSKDQSWELFHKKVQADAILSNPSIKPLAEEVVSKCGGLPLALITVGRAMANKRTPNEWNHAIKTLDDAAIKIRGMDDVLFRLKFSYDELKNDTMRSCLLYCALFPEDYDIRREELIDYWIGEGLLDDAKNVGDKISDARNKGHFLISDLQDACLLEKGLSDEQQCVRMHDSIRDMALWLTSSEYVEADNDMAVSRNG